MFVYGLLPILIGVILILNRERILDYADKLNEKNRVPINRQIMSTRLLVATIFLLLVGVIGLVKSL